MPYADYSLYPQTHENCQFRSFPPEAHLFWRGRGVTVGEVLRQCALTLAELAAASQRHPPYPHRQNEKLPFAQEEIRVQAGEMVTWNLQNKNAAAHAFDIDEFDVHILMPAQEEVTFTFTPT